MMVLSKQGMENNMQMIDVIKRLAELDAANPRVEKVAITNEQSLATVSNIEGESISECGPMGMDMGRPSMPASFSINASAESGEQVSSMLRDIMNLAGVKSPAMGDLDHDGDHDMHDHEIELGAPHAVEVEPANGGDDMADMISMIDKMNGPQEKASPVAGMADEVRDMADEMADMKDEGIGAGFDTATTTPDEKVEPHDYGNKQVKGLGQARSNPFTGLGNNNLKQESIDSVALKLLREYEAFKNQ
jgi:hypothetical protein